MVISPHYQRWQVLYPAQHSIPGDSTPDAVISSDDDTVTGQVWHGAGKPLQILKVTWHICTCNTYLVLYCISKNGPPCPPAVATISLVLGLNKPPISTMPCSVCQLVWSHLLSTNVWLVIHWPEVKDRQVVGVVDSYPPQMRRLSMVWSSLSSGSAGREQDRPVEGTKTSTLVEAPCPPDRIIPGMKIIIRVLLLVLLTLCSRKPVHVLLKAGSTDTSHKQEKQECQHSNHLLTARHKSIIRLVLNTFSALIYRN
jgi:hypothetical protein